MSSMLSRFLKRQGKNLKKHGPKMLGLASMLGFNPLGMLGKSLGGLGGGKMAGGWYPGKYLGQMFGGGQERNTPLMMNQDYLGPGGPPSQDNWFGGTVKNAFSGGGNPFKSIGQNFLGLDADEATGGGIGLGMNLLGTMGQMNAGYDSGYLKSLNRQLNPLQDSLTNMQDLSRQYLDPNSELNQRMRDSIRGDELSNFSDVLERSRSQATGTYGDDTAGAMNQNVLSDAVAKALGGHTAQLGKRQQIGTNLAGSAGTLAANLGQQRLQNMMLAQQKAQMPWQFMGQTGMGLLQRAYS